MSIVGESSPLRLLAMGTLVDLGPAILRIRLDDGMEQPAVREPVVVVVHRAKVDLLLGEVVEGESEERMMRVERIGRPD